MRKTKSSHRIFVPVKQSIRKNVADLQRLLNLIAHRSIKVDGILGTRTYSSIKALNTSQSQLITEFADTRGIVYLRNKQESLPLKNESIVNPRTRIYSRKEIKTLIRRSAISHGVNPDFAVAIARIESNFDQFAKSPTGARGLFQLTGIAIKDVKQKYPSIATPTLAGRFDVRWNIDTAVKYLHIIAANYLRLNPVTRDVASLARVYGAYNLGIFSLRKLEAGDFSNTSLKQAFSVQARYLRARGMKGYLAVVESKLDSVLA